MLRRAFPILGLVWGLCVWTLAGMAATPPAAKGVGLVIRDGDRVVFMGDGITEQRLYTTYLEAYWLTRYAAYKLSFRNVGWGGDTPSGNCTCSGSNGCQLGWMNPFRPPLKLDSQRQTLPQTISN